ncbi:MAG: UbiD family decarboxylase [Phycisphaerales bacterium]|nr:UbiD family decarboxylase [Phycisphaerales bacterium]
MYRSLGDFVAALETAGELVRVRTPVDPVLEITEIADRQSKARAPHPGSPASRRNDPRFADRGGRALLFENVEGSDFPLLINAWGSYRRMEMALGCERFATTTATGFDAIGARIGSLVKPEPPRSLGELFAKAKQFLPLLRIPPRRKRGRGPCQQVVKQGSQIDLTRLPILRCWPHDGDFLTLGYPANVNDEVPGISRGDAWNQRFRGRYITLAGIHTIHAEDRDQAKPSSHNIGMYRVQLLAKDRVAMHWHMHHDGARHWRSWKALGQKMPVAIVLGGESVMPYAATAPLPPGISELLLAGFLHGRGIEMVRGVTVPLWIPAHAEIVIEGYVNTDAGSIGYEPARDGPLGPGAVFEGPFGDHTGFYSLPDRYPIVEVTAVTHRRDAIYPTTVVGLPPQEDYFLGKATERVFFPLLKTIVHDIEDYDLPQFGTFHNCAMIACKKAYPLQGRRLMHSIWGAGQMAWTKTIFIVDHQDCDVHDTLAVLRRCGERCHPLRDVELAHGPLDILDHAAPFVGAGTKIGFDCTSKREGETVHGVASSIGPVKRDLAKLADYARSVAKLPAVTNAVAPEALGGGWLLLTIDKKTPGQGIEALRQVYRLGDAQIGIKPEELPPFVIVLSDGVGVDLADIDACFFHWCAHFDAGRDILRHHVLSDAGHATGHRLGFDATAKSPADSRHGVPARTWPPILQMDASIKAKVTTRWAEYGLA